MSEKFPVYVVTATQNGTERLRVGTATRVHDGFALTIDVSMNIGASPIAGGASESAMSNYVVTPKYSTSAVFPPYGRSKGKPVHGATMQDLEYYAAGCRRTLADDGKSRWHDKERVLLAAIEAEIARQGGNNGGEGKPAAKTETEYPPLSDSEIPF